MLLADFINIIINGRRHGVLSINGRERHWVPVCFSLISAPRSWFRV